MKFLKQYEDIFSFTEMEIILAISKGSKTYKEIAKNIYGEKAPRYATTAISGLIDRINKKCQLKKINLRIDVSETNGGPVTKTVKLV
jgi:hypothetical protein